MTGFSNKEYDDIYAENEIFYYNFPILDNDNISFKINAKEGAQKLKDLVDKFGSVYVHCTAGVNRSPKIIVMY
jgi:protein-tyrosine phosphatase